MKSEIFSTATELGAKVNCTTASPGGYGSVVVVCLVVTRGVVVVCVVDELDDCMVFRVVDFVVCVDVDVVVVVRVVVEAQGGQMSLKASW